MLIKAVLTAYCGCLVGTEFPAIWGTHYSKDPSESSEINEFGLREACM